MSLPARLPGRDAACRVPGSETRQASSVQQLLAAFFLARLEVHNLLHQLDGRSAGYIPSIDEQSRRAIYAHRFSECKGGLDSRFRVRFDCAGGDLVAIRAR